MNTEDDELLDLVDEEDRVIGQKFRSEVHAEGLHNYRVINLFLRNSKGEIWIPRRAANKRMFPLSLDMSAAGHVSSGETYEESFKREVAEELNIDVDTVPYRFLGHLSPYKDGVHAFEHVYEIMMDEVPNYNQDDFIEYFWLTPAQLFEKLANGDKSKSDLPRLVEIFYPKD